MATLDEVKKMQASGVPDQEILNSLQKKGVPTKEIYDALAQTRIKNAVSDEQYPQSTEPTQEGYQDYSGSTYAPQDNYGDSGEYGYESYQQGSTSTDTINEIAEQVVTEKLSTLRAEIEKNISARTTILTRLEYLDERLKRIEKIIDRLQISVLQKVGEYISDVGTLKKELVETQKTFKSSGHKHHSNHQHHTSSNSQHHHK